MDNSKRHFLPEWIYVPELESSITEAETLEDFLNNNTILLNILDNIQEGISILNTDMQVVYMNKTMMHWYSFSKSTGHKIKCYRLFHNAKTVCHNCPAISCLNTGKPDSAVVEFRKSTEEYGQVRVHVAPIHNSKGQIVLLLEYILNLTIDNRAQASIEGLLQEIQLLEHQNKLLINSLTVKEKQYQELTESIRRNMEQHVRPVLEYLAKKLPPKESDLLLSIIEQALFPMTMSQEQSFPTVISDLTAREYQIAALIKKGYCSKEIAKELSITKKAVDYHRANIRKKLNLSPKTSLQVYLEMNL